MDTVATSLGNHLTATLHCKFAPYRTASGIQWYKDDGTIEMTLPPSYFNATNTSLIVASDNDAVKLEGMYYCVISNTLGSVRSRSSHYKLVPFLYIYFLLLVSDGYM